VRSLVVLALDPGEQEPIERGTARVEDRIEAPERAAPPPRGRGTRSGRARPYLASPWRV
jgi:hypothetical protein